MSMRKILAGLRTADHEYNLIEDGDHIAVGISGGKDSLVMLEALRTYQHFKDKNFTLTAVFLDLGFPNTNVEGLKEYFEKNNIPYYIDDSKEVFQILSAHKDEERNLLPCSICSRMKKAAINRVAHEINCNKVAFAHHADDAIETLMMNMIFGGRVATFAPKMFLSNTKLTFIRPLIYSRESEIRSVAKEYALPVLKSPCPNNEKTMRQEMKLMTESLYKKYPYAKENMFDLLKDSENFDLYYDKKDFQLTNGYTVRVAYNQQDFFDVVNIRKEVFIKEQKIDIDEELDTQDYTSKFYLIRHNDQGVGTIRVFEKEDGYHLGRFAILKDHRNKGLGKLLIRFVEAQISSKQTPVTIILNAQYQLINYYLEMGYKISGEPFFEANIKHVTMKKTILKPKKNGTF